MLKPAHDHSAASAHDESHLIEDRLKSPESVSVQSVPAVTRSDLLTIC
jgi:hypothetical protein